VPEHTTPQSFPKSACPASAGHVRYSGFEEEDSNATQDHYDTISTKLFVKTPRLTPTPADGIKERPKR